MRSFTKGIGSYQWSDESSYKSSGAQKLLFSISGKIYLLQEDEVTESYDGRLGDAIDPHLSPCGKKLEVV